MCLESSKIKLINLNMKPDPLNKKMVSIKCYRSYRDQNETYVLIAIYSYFWLPEKGQKVPNPQKQ